MNIFETVVLGATQGLTEFIPISSSGHLEIVQRIMGGRGDDFHLFLEMINFGTLLALLIFYRKRIIKIIGDIFRRRNYKMARNLMITAIPAGVVGFLLSSLIEQASFFSSLITIAVAMGVVGVLMAAVEELPSLTKIKDEEELSWQRALVIGLAQILALIPGVSRSGSTILAGRMMGMNAKSAANYSFMASIPLMLGVCLKTVVSSSSRSYIAANLEAVLIGNGVAFVLGFLVLGGLIKFLERKRALVVFGYYRIALSGALLAIGLTS